MRLAFADPRNMTISPLNMHFGQPAPDVSDIRPSIAKRGVLVPMLVQERFADGAVMPGAFAVVAGARRLTAAQAEIAAGVDIDPVPICILDPGDDAAAIEASLIENLHRLPPDEVSTWEAFAKLIKQGRTPQEIAATFHMSEAVVNRTLALGNLLPRLRKLYRREAVNVATIRLLTLATKSQQKAWLAIHDDPDQVTPVGQGLKNWLFGGAAIPTKHALFSLEDYPGAIIADLFGEDSYFTDPGLFWTCQNAALAAKREALLAEGWSAVEVLETGRSFDSWKHERVSKAKGGKVYLSVSQRGEVTTHEGFLTAKEARRAQAVAAQMAKGTARGEEGRADPKTDRAEVTSNQQTYIDLHRHSAVRAVLTDHPGVALRLLVAHAVAGTHLWRVEPDARRAGSEAVAQSAQASPAEARFQVKHKAICALLGADPERALVGQRREGGAAGAFAKLLALPDADVLAVAAVVMGETLAAGSVEVETAGTFLKVDMGAVWTPDEAFFELMRDREAVNAMLREVGGKKVADGNLTEKVKTQKTILRDFLDGTNDRPKAARWTPKWLTFPAQAYTRRPFATAQRSRAVAPLLRGVRLSSPAATPTSAMAPAVDPNPAILAAQ
ncbi:chromosome partitioning protein ParB [Caulobacter sp. Root487D2Y]|uniref:ParB N-terminal domain-containing protein n=1 Tax=Caulobacter sp. Root487D2Y TaxID=1736547 RepID=UPI0006FFF570|nr:ParB N-terminal domain-containing protein [Caulobacter sp. Root487D2Y]KQY28285.1 chromosome partitioning protein ParB [Caulobacter sp. Root487D2Y]